MAGLSNSERLKEARRKREEEGKKSSSSSSASSRNSDKLEKLRLERNINFDTFDSDLQSMGTTIGNIYSGWQTPETMNNTRSSIEAMQNRINAYQTYQSKYGGNDLSEVASGYQSVLDDWDNLTSAYGYYQNADAFNTAKKRAQFDEQFGGLTYDEVQAKKSEYAEDSDEYKYLSEYTNYSDLRDFDKALANGKGDYLKELETMRNQYATDNKFDLYKDYMDAEDFEELSQYNSTKSDKWYSGLTSQYGMGYDDITYEYINNVDGIRDEIKQKARTFGRDSGNTTSTMEKKGYDKLNEDEIAVYNYIYENEGKEKAQAYLDDLEVMLTKRVYDETTQRWEDATDSGVLASTAMSALSVPANLMGGFIGAVEALGDAIKGKEYNPYGYYKTPSNFSADTREYVGENIAEATEGMEIFGQNIPSFLYQTGMSTADSAVGALSFGKAFAPIMGSTAFQQKAKELTEAGASEEEAMRGALASGVFEMAFEKLSLDNLFKIKNADSLGKIFKETLKQAGIEGSEEFATEVANVVFDRIHRGESSDVYQMYEEYLARGFSEEEAERKVKQDINSQIGWSFVGGALSGMAMGAGASVGNYSDLSSTGEQIRSNNRVQDMVDLSALTPEESDAYKLYTEYANKGITADNISNAKLGNLYATAEADAVGTVKSKKATTEQKIKAMDTIKGLRTVGTIKESKVTSTGKTANIEGIKKVDGNTVLVTNEGEVAVDDMTLSYHDAEMLSHVEGMSEEKANLFLAQYDGKSNLDAYADSFNMAYAYGEDGFDADTVLNNKGVLTEAQASEIYKTAITNKVTAQQKAIDDINTKYGKTVTVAGRFDDGIIDYNSTTADGSKINWNSLTTRQRDAITFAKGFSEATGVNIKLIKSDVVDGKRVGKNGSYKAETNTIEIDVYAGILDADTAKEAIIPTLSHEMTHWMKAKAPAMYSKMKNHIMETLVMGGTDTAEVIVNREMNRIQKNHPEIKVTREYAMDELVARACEDMLSNSDKARKMLNQLSKKEQSSFVAKVKETFKNLMEWVNELLGKYKSNSHEAKVLRQYKDRLKELSKMWDKALEEAVQTNQSLQAEGITGEEAINAVTEKVGVAVDSETESAYPSEQLSERTWTESEYVQEREKAVDQLSKTLGISKKKAGQYIDDVNSIARLIADDRARLDYEPSEGRSAFVSNVEYGGSIDFSTLCKKRRLYTGTISAIQEALPNTALLPEEYLAIRNMLLDRGYEATCGLCYVEGSRTMMGQYTKQFIEKYAKTNPPYVPTMAEMNTPDGQERIRFEHPEVYDKYVYFMNHYGRIDENDKAIFASQQKPKMYTMRTDYKHEIASKFKKADKVRDKNLNGGIRLQSFSDFEIVHLIDCMQVIMDMSKVGLAGQAYTKVPEFADALGNTGLKINLSLIAKGVDSEGNLIFDDVEGMPHEKAMQLRNKYSSNVGTVLVVFNRQQLESALKNPNIDYVLPFHRSQWKKAQYDLIGLPQDTEDFTNYQNEKGAKGNIMPNSYWDFNKSGRANAEKYLSMCNLDGRTPKFPFLLEKNADGTYSLPKGAIGDNYFKLLIDFKMYDNNGKGSPQLPVKPNFSMEESRKMLEDYRGGHSKFPVAHDVVDEFVAEYKKKHPQEQYSDRDSDGNQLTKAQVEYFKDSKVRDKDGKLIPMYHGSKNQFTVFDREKIGSSGAGAFEGAGFNFTPSETRAMSYGANAMKGYINVEKPLSSSKKTFTVRQLADVIAKVDPTGDDIISNYCRETRDYGQPSFIKRESLVTARAIMDYAENDVDIYSELSASGGRVNLIEAFSEMGYDGLIHYYDDGNIKTVITFNSNQFKDFNNTNPTEDDDIRYSDRDIDSWLDELSIEALIDELGFDDIGSDIDTKKAEKAKRRTDAVNKRLKQIGLSFNGSKSLAWTDERIDKYLGGGYYGSSNPDYAQAYISYVTPQQFLNLTVGGKNSTLDMIENESATYGDADIEKLGKSSPLFLDIDEGRVWTKVTGHEGRHRMYLLGKAGFEKVPVLLFDYRTKYSKTAKDEMKLIAQKYNRDDLISKSRNVVLKDVIPFSKGNRDLIVKKFGSGKEADIHYSERDNVSVYDLMGQNDTLQKQNAKLEEDVARLKERLKLEKKVTNGNTFNANQLRSVAKYLRNSVSSTYEENALVEELKEVYSYIVETPQLDWTDLMAKCYEVARNVLDKSKGYKITNDYFKDVLEDIRRARITLSEEQVQEAKNVYGDKYRNAFMGRVMLVNNGKSLDSQWQEWASMYPEIFDENVTGGDQITALSDIYDALREGAETYQQYNDAESIRSFAVEIYNQYWNVSTIRTTADKYDKQIKRLNFEHRTAMNELRSDYKKRVEDQKKADAIHYGKMISDIRRRREAEVKQAKESGRKRLTEYRDRVAKNAKIEKITKNALTLNEWLTKNSKDAHIPEVMKAPVAYLLNAIDFSSKQLLGMRGGIYANTPTKKDVSLSKALEQVHDMVQKINSAQIGEDEITEIYGTFADFPMGFADDIRDLSSKVNDIMRTVGDNAYVLNEMSLDQLEELDKILTIMKATVTKMNKFLAIRHAEGVANMSQQSINFLDGLGKAKERGKVGSKIEKMLDWGNALPYYTFKRFGEGGQKVYEALQDGWDKFAFHINDIIKYAESTYTDKEVKAWEEIVKEFSILEPATDEAKARPDYTPRYQKIKMTVPQIMSLYCLQKREQAKGHLMGGGMRVSDFKVKNKTVSQTEGVILSESEIDTIINSLTDRQRAVADALQQFMNTTCTDWGNEVSMLRFGFKAFGEENYFPIQSDKNNLAVNDETEQNNSLFRLLNMSFTKGTIKKANNRIVISDIFDVFAQHSSDMAKYNALALPVIDSFKWYNYKEKIKKGDTQFTTKSLKQSLENAFGKDAQNYIVTFLRDINGEQSAGRDVVGKGFFTNAKLASVGFNMRVVALQPTAYARANAVIDQKYLTKAFLHKPKMQMAQKHCGIALWKSLGFYDINVQNSVTDLIKHNQTARDKVVEASMKGAEIADKLTWGYLWNACELEVRDKQKNLKVGSDEFYSAVANRLREVIYTTQVVDSTMTRSHMMRSKDGWDKMATAFMSEPTLAYNMLQDCYMDWKLTERQTGSKQKAFKKCGKKMARVFTAYTVTNLLSALVESGFDVFRDDEEEVTSEEFIELYLKNFASNMNILNNIPYAKEAMSMMQGFSSSRTDTQWMQYLTYTITGFGKLLEGEGNAYTTAKNAMRAFSYATGLPFYNVWRDSTALLDKTEALTAEELEEMFNETIADIFPSLKSK